jgi:hypothetical protein
MSLRKHLAERKAQARLCLQISRRPHWAKAEAMLQGDWKKTKTQC